MNLPFKGEIRDEKEKGRMNGWTDGRIKERRKERERDLQTDRQTEREGPRQTDREKDRLNFSFFFPESENTFSGTNFLSRNLKRKN